MREQQAELDKLNIRVVVVTFENDYFARQYVWETGLKWPVLLDESRELYCCYGMMVASFLDLWGPRSWWAYGKELLKGAKLHRATNDVHQRGGDVLIDPEGLVRLHHVGLGPADRPAVGEIVAIVRRQGQPERQSGR